MTDIPELPQQATLIAEGVRHGTVSAAEVLDDHLARVDAREGEIHAFNLVLADQARARAAEVDSMVAEGRDPGALAGVPVALKDNMCTHGIPTTYSSKILGDWKPRVLFVGDEGMLVADLSHWKLLPESKFADFELPEPTIPESIGHHKEWITACKTGSPTTCNFDYGGALTETVLLGNIAKRMRTRLEWDGDALKVTNNDEANQYIQAAYREGWSL